MRIFNREGTKDKLYVQVSDIKLLVLDKNTPRSISELICDIYHFDQRYQDDDFVCIEDKEDIKFIEEHDWIADLRKYRFMPIQDIKREIRVLKPERRTLTLDVVKEPVDYNEIFNEKKLLSLEDIISYRLGRKDLSLPLVPDFQGVSFSADNINYKMSESLDFMHMLLFRKDGKELSIKEQLPSGFFNMGFSIYMMERSKRGSDFSNYEINNYMSEDKKYMVTGLSPASEPRVTRRNYGTVGFIKKLLFRNNSNK